MTAPFRLLIVKTSSLGDIIHAFPALTDAARALPGLAVDWVAEESFSEVARLHPAVDEVIPVATRRWRKAAFSAETRGEIARLRQRLQKGAYDLVLDAQGLFKSALIARAAGRPVAGMDWASVRWRLASLVYAKTVAVPKGQHAVLRQRQLFAGTLGYDLPETPADFGLARPAGGDRREVFLLHGTTWATKRLPDATWIAVAEGLAARGLVPVVTSGSPAEQAVAETITAAVPGTVLLPKSGLATIAARLAAARAVIGADTGLMHLAAACDVPTLGLYLATDPGLTGPIGPQARHLQAGVACSPCRAKTCRLVAAGAEMPCQTAMGAASILAAFDAMGERP